MKGVAVWDSVDVGMLGGAGLRSSLISSRLAVLVVGSTAGVRGASMGGVGRWCA